MPGLQITWDVLSFWKTFEATELGEIMGRQSEPCGHSVNNYYNGGSWSTTVPGPHVFVPLITLTLGLAT